MDNKKLQETVKETREKVDSFYQRNDAELQSIRDLIDVRNVTYFLSYAF